MAAGIAGGRGARSGVVPGRLQRVLATAGGVLGAVAVWGLAEGPFGLQLRVPSFGDGQPSHELAAAAVAVVALIGCSAAWTVLAVLERVRAGARRLWLGIALAAFVVSLAAPLSGHGVSAANRLALEAMHVVVAMVVVPALYRSSATRPEAHHRLSPSDR